MSQGFELFLWIVLFAKWNNCIAYIFIDFKSKNWEHKFILDFLYSTQGKKSYNHLHFG